MNSWPRRGGNRPGPWHGKECAASTRAHEEDRVDRTVLVLLLDRERPWPCSIGELARELALDPSDGLARLHGAGLICRLGGFVRPTRAAVRADELQL